uniref:Methyltransferase type 11 domain-containing protein n=1 Tax=mine drainage metagenome TaxID=410659 RepID=E6PH45_9ZZZZ
MQPTITEDALVAYYEIRARAEQRFEAVHGQLHGDRDDLRDRVEAAGEALYRQRLGSLRDLTIGEIGIGSGDFVRYAFQERAREMYLIDISKDRLLGVEDELKTLGSTTTTTTIVANAQQMNGINDGELDLLVAKEVIEHLTDYRPFLSECRRVLRTGGRLYLTTPNRHCIDLWPRVVLTRLFPPKKLVGEPLIRKTFDHLFEYVTAEECALLANSLPPGFKEHIHEFAPRELLDALAAHGFRVLRRWGTPPQMFYNELRPFAEAMLPGWVKADGRSYALGDDLRIIAENIS